MKKILRILVLIAVVSVFAVTKSKAQISVKLQLNRPPQYENNERVHPPRPSPNHLWIAEEWVPNGSGSYNYVPGHWDLPPETKWIAGHWQASSSGGYVWIKGYFAVFARGNQVRVFQN